MNQTKDIDPAPVESIVIRRRWLFRCEDWNDDEFCLDAEGNETCEDEAVPWIGSDKEAHQEADRRCDLWEEANNAFVAKVTMESRGRV